MSVMSSRRLMPDVGPSFSAGARRYIFPLGGMQGYLNLKGYGEFDAHDRASGYNVWLTFAISPAAPTPSTPKGPMYHKWTKISGPGWS
jgi:hypothetical protein